MPGHTGMKKYRDMMKRMEGMGEEKIPAPMNMGMESMRNLDSMAEENIPARKNMGMDSLMEMKGSMSDRELDMLAKGMAEKDALKNSAMAGMGSGSISDSEMKMLEDLMGDSLTDEVKLALESLLRMGMSMSDSIEALQATDGMTDTMNVDTMTEGALGALPQRDLPMPRPEMNPESFGQDRTQSMEMQKPMNT